MAYAVPVGTLQRLRGSKDAAKLAQLKTELAAALADNDEFFEDLEDEEAEGEATGCLGAILRLVVGKKKFEAQQERARISGPVPKSAELLEAYINGAPIDLRCGSKTGYVLKMICEKEGKILMNAGLESIRRGQEWMATLDKDLGAKGIQLGLEKNCFDQGERLGVPEPDDFPGLGFFPNAVWMANNPKLQAIDTSSVKLPSYLTDDDDDEDDVDFENQPPMDYNLLAIKSLQSWGSAAVDGNCDIVTFYH